MGKFSIMPSGNLWPNAYEVTANTISKRFKESTDHMGMLPTGQ